MRLRLHPLFYFYSSIYPLCAPNYLARFSSHIHVRNRTILIVCSPTSPASARVCSLSSFALSKENSVRFHRVLPIHYCGDGGIRQSGTTSINESSEESAWTPRSFIIVFTYLKVNGSRSMHNAISGSVPPEGSYLLLKRKTGILFIQMCCSLHTHF